MINRRSLPMNCKEFIHLIPMWLNDKLDGRRAVRFFEHMENCPDCREEMQIQFLVKEGTARLESGGSLNLDRELSDKMARYQKRLKRKHTENVIIYWMEAISALAILFLLILVFIKM